MHLDILGLLTALLVVLAVPFVVPIAAWVSARRVRRRLEYLETVVAEQQSEIHVLSARLEKMGRAAAAEPPVPPAMEAEPVAPQEHAPPPVPVQPVEEPETAPPIPAPEVPALEKVPIPIAHIADEAARPSALEAEPERPAHPEPEPERVEPPIPPYTQPAPVARTPAFDWENLVGVKLFSAIAGIALVLAAIFFLRYSIEHGWLQPPVRVAIGLVVAVGLLIACELKAARRYPVTANALDAAAIAILFSTFFAAHALWNLIPASATFGLLAIVTALAVLLSIRRESLFIAVLGLLGGFATPALLSTGENRPIPLFAYLLMLNIGLAWIAYRKTWPVLTWLTLVLTTVYQWGWVFRFLDSSSLPLAMGVFIVFPVASVAALLVGGRSFGGDAGGPSDVRHFERSALIAAGLPALFAVYLAAVPAYGARPALLFGFVLLLDIGLLAIAMARRHPMMHATAALTTVLAMATWLAVSYAADARHTAVAFTAVFVLLYLFAPAIANRFGRPLADRPRTAYAAPFLLFVCAALAGVEPAFAQPWPLFAPLLALVLLIAWRASATATGGLYFVAAFFAVAAQAIWSAEHLVVDRLGTAVAVYAAFGVAALLVPILARRLGRPLEPVWGGGAVLLASLLLLLFIAAGDVAPAALWSLALLLAILNAALFVESAAGRLPLVSQCGSVLSWIVLLMWWGRAAASVGVMPSLTVLTGLTLITLAGHAWTVATTGREGKPGFSSGLYLGLAGHLFLTLLASNPEWSIPPWPLFGSLAVITLAMTAAALVTHVITLHAAGAIAAAVVVASWSLVASPAPYAAVAIAAALAVSAYAIAWIRLVPPAHGLIAGIAAGAALFVGEVSVLGAVASGGSPPFAAVVAGHTLNIGAILWLTWRWRWKGIAVAAVAPAWLAVQQSTGLVRSESGWIELLILSAALYAVFVAYPLVLGSRASRERDPYLAAVVASIMFFFGARSAFAAGDLTWMIGVVPIAAGAVLALLLRQLLRLQAPGERDLGRLALVAGAALACVTVAIPLQLERQWITIGWALEGAALAWLYRRIPHRGLLLFGVTLLAAVFVRLALNPEVLVYEPRGAMRILNWYLYTYALAAVSMIIAGGWLSTTDDRLFPSLPRASHMLPAAGVILLFILLNIEIADFYATGPTVTFRFGVTVSQDLTYTIGWLAFGMALLAAGIYLGNRPARVAAVSLIAVTTFKCFLYDLGSLAGLYRVASFVGLAMSLALVSLALQKFVLSKPRETA